eukprot:GHRR01028842.1.p1 GENE.GHRR01028842.1~~GHRR01028842.1.p1  ORF type:complete len:125 (+),score=29.91 GHRR01028842.1:829-1203(+)
MIAGLRCVLARLRCSLSLPMHYSLVMQAVSSYHGPKLGRRMHVYAPYLQVLVSEFNAQPRKVTVTGSAVPGLARDRLVAEATRGQAGTPELAHGAAGELRSTRADGRIKPGEFRAFDGVRLGIG